MSFTTTQSLSNCLDRLQHTVAYLADTLQTSRQLLKHPVHSRIRIQQDYQWVPEESLAKCQERWYQLLENRVMEIENRISLQSQAWQVEEAQLQQDIQRAESTLLKLEKDEQAKMEARRSELLEKRKTLEARHKQLVAAAAAAATANPATSQK